MCMNPAAAEKLPEEMTTCLCNQHFRTKGINLNPESVWLPEWRFNKAKGLYILTCPSCNYSTEPFDNKNAVIAYWSLINKKGDDHVLRMWGQNYEKMNITNNQVA